MMLRMLLFALCALPLRAATVILTVTGRVLSTTAGDFFPSPPIKAGDLWTATITCAYPTLAIPPGFLGIENYVDPGGQVLFSVNSLSWTAPRVGGFVGGIGTPQMEASLGSSYPSGAYALLEWFGGSDLIPDTTSLPDSFSKWNLPSASSFRFIVISDNSTPGVADSWSVTANAWDTMTIQVIPEPSGSAFVSTIAMAALLRRRRLD